MSAAQSRRAENVVELFDGVVEGTDSPLVPDGEYLATYLGHDVVELAQFKKAPKVFLRLRCPAPTTAGNSCRRTIDERRCPLHADDPLYRRLVEGVRASLTCRQCDGRNLRARRRHRDRAVACAVAGPCGRTHHGASAAVGDDPVCGRRGHRGATGPRRAGEDATDGCTDEPRSPEVGCSSTKEPLSGLKEYAM